MIRIRRGRVLSVRERHPGLLEATVEIDGARATALAYPDLTGEITPGDIAILNTTAVALDLGTGGAHFVMAVEGRETDERPAGHAMKLRYTPSQTVVAAAEETHRQAVDAVTSLDAMPVIVAGLHSAVAPAAIGVRSVAPGARVAYVMTEGGALPLLLSDAVPAMRAAGLLDVSITSGHTFGGDLEAVTLPGALATARVVAGADLVVAAMGPGNIGTGSRWGFGLIEVATIINVVAAMGGRPIVAPRVSFADQRARHRGVSHHTLTALGLALAPAEIVLPQLTADRAAFVREQLAPLLDKHTLTEVDLGEVDDVLRDSPVPLRTMGRALDDDPDYFRTAAAAGVHAGRAATSRR